MILKPTFSVILTTYNCLQYIEDTIKSILEQTFSDFELLIIDDCSTDGTYELICKLVDKRVRIFQTENQSGGPAIPRNIGLNHAIGNYIAFCDGDDIYLSNHLQIAFKLINNFSLSHFILSFNAKIIDKNVQDDSYFKSKRNEFKLLSFNKIFYSNKVIFSSMIISNDNIILFSNIKSPNEDYLFILNNIRKGFSLYYSSSINISYRKNSINSRSKMNTGLWLLKTKYIDFKFPLNYFYNYPFFLFIDIVKALTR